MRVRLQGLLQHPREVAIVVGLTLGGTVAFYTYTTYMQKFLVNSVGLSKDTSTVIAAGTLFLYMCLQPVVGAISDIVGRRPVLLTFGVLGTLLTVPILTALQTAAGPWTAFFLIMGALVIVSGYTAINAVVKAELFPTGVRAMGVGFPYAITVALFGGTAEYVALYLKEIGYEHAFFWYVTALYFHFAAGLRVHARHARCLRHAPPRLAASCPCMGTPRQGAGRLVACLIVSGGGPLSVLKVLWYVRASFAAHKVTDEAQKHRDYRPRRPRQDHARRRIAQAIRLVPRGPARG